MGALASNGKYGMALYAGHHAGDYWVQSDHDAAHKGLPGKEGHLACLRHVLSYTATQAVMVGIQAAATKSRPNLPRLALGLAVSAVTHYAADRRDHGLMVKLAKRIPGKEKFLKLGVPRQGARYLEDPENVTEPAHYSYDDNPSLGTGSWALDQSWHIVLGVFLPSLIIGDDE